MTISEVIGAAVLVAINVLLSCLAITLLWLWFVTPLGVPAISLAQALGLTVFVMFFKLKGSPILRSELVRQIPFTRRICYQIGMSIGAIGLGYIASLFM